MCEVLSPDGTPHPSNHRATIEDDDKDFWFGFEQEYFLWDIKQQASWISIRISFSARTLLLLVVPRMRLEETSLKSILIIALLPVHVKASMQKWLLDNGNSVLPKAKEAGDQWIARYLLERTAENMEFLSTGIVGYQTD
jgi:glutamine synthetase